ncbi:hypothetical protein CRYUN_Cryun01aG0081600 [Craigia yunnanensis]
MKAAFVFCFLFSSVLVFPFAIVARELHNVEHNGGSTDFPVNGGTANPKHRPISCHKQGVYYICNIPIPQQRGPVPPSGPDCPTYIPRSSPCPCLIK